MGLDVYMKHKNEAYLAGDAINEKFDAESESFSDGRRKSLGKEHYKLPEYGEALRAMRERHFGSEQAWSHHDTASIELPSTKYPEHIFKIGYFQSSYNSGGFNCVMRNLGLPDLYKIFGAQFDESAPVTKWSEALVNARDALSKFQGRERVFAAFFVGPNPFGGDTPVSNEQRAIDIAVQEIGNKDKAFSSYSKSSGEFFCDGLKIVALVHGAKSLVGESRGVYVVHEQDAELRELYTQALEIVIETCEYVLNQPDPERWVLHWCP